MEMLLLILLHKVSSLMKFLPIRYTFPLLSILLTFPVSSQVIERNNTNSGTSRVFTYSIQSTYGTQTSANASPNLKVETEAVLNLQRGSYITNKAGDIGGTTSAVFTASPGGTNVQLTGISADNLFLIDSGSRFRTALSTTTPDGQPSIGQASATATHTMTLTVSDTQTSFYNTLRQNFEGAQ